MKEHCDRARTHTHTLLCFAAAHTLWHSPTRQHASLRALSRAEQSTENWTSAPDWTHCMHFLDAPVVLSRNIAVPLLHHNFFS